jgi:hypothetical protein
MASQVGLTKLGEKRLSGSKWRMEKMCDNCPFDHVGPGRMLRASLRPGRWREILRSLRSNLHFTCHKTGRETGNGSELICAGAIAWQEKRGLSSNLQRVMERIEGWRIRGK